MSADAERYVQTCTHPKVIDGTYRLFDAIARAIPEGQTTTPPIGMPELAASARLHRVTVVTLLKDLVEIGELEVLDRRQGRVARYRIVHLDGEHPPTAAPLPLRADLRSVPPRAQAMPLFESVEDPGRERTAGDQRVVSGYKYGRIPGEQLVVRGYKFAQHVVQLVVSGYKYVFQLVVSGYKLLPQGVDVADSATTTYVRSKKDPDPEVVVAVVEDARAREPADEFLEWFERTYPRFHHGAVCLIHQAQDRRLTRELLERPGTDVAHLQAMTVLLWSLMGDGTVVGTDPWWITHRVTVRDVFILHRKANYLDVEVRRRQQPPIADTGVDVWARVLERLEGQVNRHTFYTWFKPTAFVAADDGTVTVRVPSPLHADWLTKHYGTLIDAAIVAATQPGMRVVFVTDDAREKFG